MAYVYSHHKADTGEIFYIGIGKSNVNTKRAEDVNKRNPLWKKIYVKHGRTIQIIINDIEWEDALLLEKELIEKYGRICTKTGILANITIGGTGCQGFPITDEYREKLSIALKKSAKRNFGEANHFFGKTHTEETRERISIALKATDKNKGINNSNYGKKLPQWQVELIRKNNTGRKHTEEAKIKIRAWGKGKPKSEEWKAKVSGSNCHFYGVHNVGSLNTTAKKCQLIETGEIFGCLKEACQILGISYNTQLAYIKPYHVRHHKRKFNWI